MTRCSTCELKCSDHNTQTEDIWGFNPYSSTTYNEMRENFSRFVEQTNFNPFTFNEEGYTYTQWYIYYLAKNTYKSKKLYRATLWLFRVLSFYPFFSKLIRMGKRDDPLHNTLHHFFLYLDQFKTPQRTVVDLLLEYGLEMDSEDSEGRSGTSMFYTKNMSDEHTKRVNQLTRDYKLLERHLFSHPLISSSIEKCEECSDEIDKYRDLTSLFPRLSLTKETETVIEMMKIILQKREECNAVYISVFTDSNSIQRHQYIVDVYKNLLQTYKENEGVV